MKTKLVTSLALLLIVFTTSVYADRGERIFGRSGGDLRHRSSKPNQKYWRSKPNQKHFRFDTRYHHNRQYPRRGYMTKRLPFRRPPIRYRNHDYFFHRGIWYRPSGPRFTVVVPPIGIVVPNLPSFYTTLWFGNIPYYYANDVYYTWEANRNGYVVTKPPRNLVEEEEPPLMAEELFIYPKNGQNERQQADDRYGCHRWSVSQTDYDPTFPAENISVSSLNQRREDYQRAMRACLEGRGYSVR
ncbi:MAG: DUF6515 family protein [Methylococcaceae bacterium]|nr:DUF6515 family protein [Methylococcaceae bacterium]